MAKHGERGTYTAGCRCEECRSANRQYQSRRARVGYATTQVDATEVRAHIQWLRANGMGARTIAEAAGIARSTITQMERSTKTGRPKATCSIETARRIMAVHHELPGGAPVDGIGLRRRIQALAAIGWSFTQLDRRLGMEAGYTSNIARRGIVRTSTRAKIIALYDQLWNASPPDSTRAERFAKSRALNLAQRNFWPSPLAWDDDEIDDPAAEPHGFVAFREPKARPLADVIEDFEDTRDHHGGLVIVAAERLGMKPQSLERQLFRARDLGIEVQFNSLGVHAKAAS